MVGEALVAWWIGAIVTMSHTLGSEGAMKAYGPVMRQIGKDKTLEMIKMMPPKSADAIGLASLVNLWEESMGIEGHVEEATPERVSR